MQGDDLYSGAALGGAASGAASGAMIGSTILPGWGTAVGGLAGGALGLFGGAEANSMRSSAASKQSSAMDQIMANMQAMGASTYDQHIADLQKALAFYGPAQKAWDRLYGTGTGPATTGQGSWSGTNIPSAQGGAMVPPTGGK